MYSPDGTVQNNNTMSAYPNTNSYALGYEIETGITIDFGTVGPKMVIIVNLEPPPSCRSWKSESACVGAGCLWYGKRGCRDKRGKKFVVVPRMGG